MADTSDVERSLVSLIAGAVLLPGYESGSVGTSSILAPDGTNAQIRLFRGWPVRKQLDADLIAGITDVSIFPRPEEANTTRYSREWQRLTPALHSVTATIVGTVITFGGSVSKQNVGLVVNQNYYIHTLLPTETLSDLAAALATLASADTIAHAVGATLSLPLASRLEVRVGGFATYARELKRVQRTYQVTFWAPTPEFRDLLASAIDLLLVEPQWLTLTDGSSARLYYHNSLLDDGTERVGVYRRDLFYSVEFATTQSLVVPEVVIAVADYTVLPDPQIIREIIA